MEKAILLSDLQTRIENLEKEVAALRAGRKPAPKANPRPPREVKDLLTDLAAAHKSRDKAAAMKIRRQLRKAGYSLRENNKNGAEKKAETEKPKTVKAKTTKGRKNTKLRKKEK